MAQTYPIWKKSARVDPQPLWARIRDEEPVHRAIGPETGRAFWFLTRYDDCLEALMDPRIGKEFRKHLDEEQIAAQPQSAFEDQLGRNLLSLDPPDHTRLRKLVNRAFTPRVVRELEPRIEEIVADLLDAAEKRGEMDVIADFGVPLPVTVIAELLGVPLEDRDNFREWSKALIGLDVDDAERAAFSFVTYLNELIERRSQDLGDDLLSRLIEAEEAGESLDRTELLSMMVLLLIAGHETTVNLVGNGLLALLDHPEQHELLRREPELIGSAVEEMLRFNGPVEIPPPRWAFDDVEIGGVVVPKGELVAPVLLAANRDPDRFADPDAFDVTRRPNDHIAFGHGIHFCLGAPLARLEASVAFARLLERFERIELAVERESLRWSGGLLIHGVDELPVVLAH
jgi:cytochrome P450